MSMFQFGDFEDDPIFGQMRQMNNMMNSLFADPFAMMGGNGGFGGNFGFPNGLMHSMNPVRHSMVNYVGNNNRLLGGIGMPESGMSYSSSSVFSMSTGLDGRPQIYQASSSTKTGPNGIKETKKTVQDSQSGIKKMAIGHHIDNRSKIIEKEQNIRTGEQEERQEYINLDESDGEDFDKEFQQRARQITPHEYQRSLTTQPLLAIQSSEDAQHETNRNRLATPRRAIRQTTVSPLVLPSNSSELQSSTRVQPHPYNPKSSRKGRTMKGQYQKKNHQ